MDDRPLILYSLPECPRCEAAREYLRRRAAPFVERDVRKDPSALSDLACLTGESIVPTIVFGDDVQVGWDLVRVADMLDDPLPPEEEDLLLAFIEQEAARPAEDPGSSES